MSKFQGLFFLDSGAHSLYNEKVLKKKQVISKVKEGEYDFYETDEFWAYCDAYAAFVKKHEKIIDYYANIDVIYNPELTYKVQRYLEDTHHLKPVPVVHFGTGMEWVKKYFDYPLLGVGGLGQGATKKPYIKWADKLFDYICPAPKRLPIIRTHGFAMTGFDLIHRYPWFSVDSATWTKVGGFGGIFVPHKRKGKFVFNEEPYVISTSVLSPNRKESGKHYSTLTTAERLIVDEWLGILGLPLGKMEGDKVVENGVMTNHSERKIANLLYFEKMRDSLPEWPWPFKAVKEQSVFDL